MKKEGWIVCLTGILIADVFTGIGFINEYYINGIFRGLNFYLIAPLVIKVVLLGISFYTIKIHINRIGIYYKDNNPKWKKWEKAGFNAYIIKRTLFHVSYFIPSFSIFFILLTGLTFKEVYSSSLLTFFGIYIHLIACVNYAEWVWHHKLKATQATTVKSDLITNE